MTPDRTEGLPDDVLETMRKMLEKGAEVSRRDAPPPLGAFTGLGLWKNLPYHLVDAVAHGEESGVVVQVRATPYQGVRKPSGSLSRLVVHTEDDLRAVYEKRLESLYAHRRQVDQQIAVMEERFGVKR